MKAGFFISIVVLLNIGVYIKAQEILQENGFTRIFYPNGKISSEGFMRNGKPDGFWKTFYPSGIIKSEGKRTNFLLDSVWVFFNEAGDTLQKVNFVMGKRNGYTYGYNSRGNTSDPMNRGRIIRRSYS